jgi:hypothetical protein
MNKLFFMLVMIVPMTVFAAPGTTVRDPRVGITGMSGTNYLNQNRAMIASKNQLTTPDISLSTEPRSPSIKDDDIKPNGPKTQEKDQREAERMACLNNNIGIGNTFVWASRYSNTNNYATMQEDVDNPENNVCFVKVDMRSTDARIDTSDIPSRYFQWGDIINCGSWVDEAALEQRILDAKKSGRTWATVGGAVGGAAVGVGAMELFGNRAIGGKVEGQKNKNLSETEVLKSQLLTLKNNKDSRYDEFMTSLRKLQSACAKLPAGTRNEHCDEFDFDSLLSL